MEVYKINYLIIQLEELNKQSIAYVTCTKDDRLLKSGKRDTFSNNSYEFSKSSEKKKWEKYIYPLYGCII